MVTIVYAAEKPVWAGKTSPGEIKLPTVDVVEGKTVEIDIPVENHEGKATGIYSPVLVAPPGNPEEAVKRLNAVLEKNPKDIDALQSRANALVLLGDERKAIADYALLIKLDPPFPRNVGVYNNLACILAMSPDDGVRDGKRRWSWPRRRISSIKPHRRTCSIPSQPLTRRLAILNAR